MTGQFQTANSGTTDAATLLAKLKASFCGTGSTVFDCSGVKVDVKLGSSFAASTPSSPVDPATKAWASGFGTNYACASPGAILIATAAVKFPVYFSILNAGMASFADGSKLLQSTVVLRTEPYDTGTNPPC